MLKRRVFGVLAIAALAGGCDDAPPVAVIPPAGGGGGVTTPSGSQSAPPAEPVVAPPAPSAPATAPVTGRPTHLTFRKAEILRNDRPVDVAELKALGWQEVDLARGSATFYDRTLGTEHVRWSVPPNDLPRMDYFNPTPAMDGPFRDDLFLWLTADATALAGSSLAHQPYIALVGTEKDTSVQVTAYSENGKQADSEQASLLFDLDDNANVGDRAQVQIHLGWQAMGFLIVYRYEYTRP